MYIYLFLKNLIEIISETLGSSSDIYKITTKIFMFMRDEYKWNIEDELDIEFDECISNINNI